MATPKRPVSLPTILATIQTLRFRLAFYQLQASTPSEERRAAVKAPYPQGSSAAEDYLDGYMDYQNAALQFEVLQLRGDRSSYYGQGWQACAQDM
jgi:hypothetical protein